MFLIYIDLPAFDVPVVPGDGPMRKPYLRKKGEPKAPALNGPQRETEAYLNETLVN